MLSLTTVACSGQGADTTDKAGAQMIDGRTPFERADSTASPGNPAAGSSPEASPETEAPEIDRAVVAGNDPKGPRAVLSRKNNAMQSLNSFRFRYLRRTQFADPVALQQRSCAGLGVGLDVSGGVDRRSGVTWSAPATAAPANIDTAGLADSPLASDGSPGPDPVGSLTPDPATSHVINVAGENDRDADGPDTALLIRSTTVPTEWQVPTDWLAIDGADDPVSGPVFGIVSITTGAAPIRTTDENEQSRDTPGPNSKAEVMRNSDEALIDSVYDFVVLDGSVAGSDAPRHVRYRIDLVGLDQRLRQRFAAEGITKPVDAPAPDAGDPTIDLWLDETFRSVREKRVDHQLPAGVPRNTTTEIISTTTSIQVRTDFNAAPSFPAPETASATTIGSLPAPLVLASLQGAGDPWPKCAAERPAGITSAPVAPANPPGWQAFVDCGLAEDRRRVEGKTWGEVRTTILDVYAFRNDFQFGPCQNPTLTGGSVR